MLIRRGQTVDILFDVTNPGLCAFSNGQGADSDEHMTYTVPADCTSCTYYVVVRGFNGASSPYDITIAVD